MKQTVLTVLLFCFIAPAFGDDFDFGNVDTTPNKGTGEDEEPQKIKSRDVFKLIADTDVTAASKIRQDVLDAPSVISVIPAKRFLDYGYISINDALYAMPGFFPNQDYDRRTIGSRGMFEGWNNNHFLLLVDGVPMNDNLYGSAYTWEITPVNMIRSMEVIRGPGSALYGSNATNGVIAVNTLSGSDLNGAIETRARYGTQKRFIYDVMTGNTGELFSYFVAYNYFSTDGIEFNSYDDFNESGRTKNGKPYKARTNDSRQSNYLLTKLEGEGALEGLEFQFHHQYWDFETGHGWFFMLPDQRESMQEWRQILSVKYQSAITPKLKQEYVLRFQHHGIDWNMRYAPDDAYGGGYPDGADEFLRTGAEDLFGRAQYTYFTWRDMSFLGGVEADVFNYDGDEGHHSNTNTDNAFSLYGGDNHTHHQGPWFDWIKDNPVYKYGIYTQYSTGTLFTKYLTLTTGVRLDEQRFTFTDLATAGRPERQKKFSQISPRAALVGRPADNLSLKLMAGQAFREPAPSEMFGAHTWSLASNLKNLKPETMQTVEFATEWRISRTVGWNSNFYYTNFENQIVYSEAQANLSDNVYSLTTGGFETDLNLNFKNYGGFINYTFAQRLDETIDKDSRSSGLVSQHPLKLTWAPAHSAKLGATYEYKILLVALSVLYQHEVLRRDSDFFTGNTPGGSNRATYKKYRPESVPAFVDVGLRLVFEVHESFFVGAEGQNLLNSSQRLVKNGSHPFDYMRTERRVNLFLRGYFR